MAEMTLTIDQWKAISKSEMQERIAASLARIDAAHKTLQEAGKAFDKVTSEEGAKIAQLNDLQSYIDAITPDDIAGDAGAGVADG
jgi:hypothetical protein